MHPFQKSLPFLGTIAAIAITLPAIATFPTIATMTQTTPAQKTVRTMAQAPALPFPLDGKAVYVSRHNTWNEARLMGYRWSSNAGFRYTVTYLNDNSTEQDVQVNRIITLAEAQKRGIATNVYDLSSQTGINQMLSAHNEWRNRYSVPSLTWSPQLAAVAQEWATKLVRENRFQHRPNNQYGENLAAAQGQQLSPARVVEMWGLEVKDYSYASNTCKPGKMCGHFTQVVWRSTKQVGCGMARLGDREVWVCNYNPPGNFVGQRPY